MGWCHEFGPQIQDGCSHPMVAGADRCTCGECGADCRGRFNGCSAVWALGPIAAPLRTDEPTVLAKASFDGRPPHEVAVADFSLGPRVAPSEPALTPIRLAPITPLAAAPAVVAKTFEAPASIAPITVRDVPVRVPPPVRESIPLPTVSIRRHDGVREGEALRVVRERLDGLRDDLKSLGRTLERRGARSPGR